MPVKTVNVPERTYTGQGVPVTDNLPVRWVYLSAQLTLSNAAKAQWVAQNPEVRGEIVIERADPDGNWFAWWAGTFAVGDGDPNLVQAGKQIGLPGFYIPNDDNPNEPALSRQVRVAVNTYLADPNGAIQIGGLPSMYNVGGSFTAGMRIEIGT